LVPSYTIPNNPVVVCLEKNGRLGTQSRMRRWANPNVLAAFDGGSIIQEVQESLLGVCNVVGKSYPEVFVNGYDIIG
jgi:hypothetical protein